MQNIEFKAELRNLPAAAAQCRVLGGQFIGTLELTDTYFKLADGRLKRRVAEGEPIEWIYYHRPDRISPKMCTFTILSEDQARLRWGTHSLREWLVVNKRRDLWLLEDVRINLDDVARLGQFIEFEAIVTKNSPVMACHEAIAELRDVYGPLLGEPISVSYCDLMAQELAESA